METITLAVIGSRHFKNKNRVYFEIDELRKIYNIKAITSGVSFNDEKDTGPDTYGRDYAKDHNIEYIGYPADWKDMSEPCIRKMNQYGEYNALAGFKRNTSIVETGDVILSIYDGKSKGTKDSMEKAEKLGKKIIEKRI